MRLKSREVFSETPRPGILALGNSFYTRSKDLDKMRVLSTMTRSDTADTIQRGFSGDNGRTWSEPEPVEFITQTPAGVHRKYAQPGFVDPITDRLLTMVVEGILPGDDPLEGMKQWHLRYRVSWDDGRTNIIDEQVVQRGNYTPEHPCRGVWAGRNGMMVGDNTCRPIRTRRGDILVPVQVTPVGPDGEYYNPGGGYTYHHAAVLIGRWTESDRIEWDLSDYIENNPARSTRGALEPTLAQMPDDRILMVLRGSNDASPDLPGYKWYSVSGDGGRTWGPIRAWTYTDGSNFYSPSSCSQLMLHSNGRYYWLGNITGRNPRGNRPRYPLVIGEVDPDTLLLVKKTVTVVDDCQPGDDEGMCLSNFMAHEDRENGDVVLHMTRMFTRKAGDWTADASIYRIEP